MPFVEPDHPYTRPARVMDHDDLPEWDGTLDVADGYAVLRQVHVNTQLPLDECRELELIGCRLSGVSFARAPGIELEVNGSHFETCDLSQITTRSILRSSFDDCKFIGADLSGSSIEDVIFRGGMFRYTNLRMASYQRVAFSGCTLVEADFYESKLGDVSFDKSELHDVVFDKCRLERVDLRRATALGLTVAGDLTGALITNQQVIELAHLFALATGIGIERD